MIFSRRTDIALHKDGQGRFLPWLIAFMVFLAVLAAAGVVVLSTLVDRWDHGVSGTMTVQIAPGDTENVDYQRRQAALLLLRATDGVARADLVASEDVRRLLEPWLGPAVGNGLPLPQLIDVELTPGVTLDAGALQNRLAEAVPGIAVDDHRVWLDRLVQMFETARLLAYGVLFFILLATIGTVIFTTRTGLAIHQEAIEVLHLIGARDAYIAAQFAARAMMMGLKGGLLGLMVALPCLYGIGWLASKLEQGLIPDVTFTPVHWAGLVFVPIFVAFVAALSARFTVMKTLSRML